MYYDIMTNLGIDDVDFENRRFWRCFFRAEWGSAYDEETDVSAAELMDEQCPLSEDERNWWYAFIGYSKDIFTSSDGYVPNPSTFQAELDGGRIFKIEFYPGDTVYYIDGQEIGCTGPHDRKISPIPYHEAEKWLGREQGEPLFFLLLPMARLADHDGDAAAETTIASLLTKIFDPDICADLAKCMTGSLK